MKEDQNAAEDILSEQISKETNKNGKDNKHAQDIAEDKPNITKYNPIESSISDSRRSTAEEIVKEILFRLKKQVTITDEFENSFMESMTSKLDIATSQEEIDLVDSLSLSIKFKKAFTAQVIEIIKEKLKEDSNFNPTLKTMKIILKEVESELREEGTFKKDDGEILVWNAKIIYNNPILNNQELLKSVSKHYSMDKVIDMSAELDKELIAESIANNDSDLLLAGIISVEDGFDAV